VSTFNDRLSLFDVYSRLRTFDFTGSKGKLHPCNQKYQPPFLLRRDGDQLIIDLLLISDLRSLVVSDDIGSLLFACPPVKEGANPLTLTRLMFTDFTNRLCDEGKSCLGQITLSIFAEGVSASLLDLLDAEFAGHVQPFAIFPTPAVRARFPEDFEEDAIVFEPPEQMIEGERFVQPTASCFVMSPRHTAYKISIYRGGNKNELSQYATRMSALSWLTARPGSENRWIAFPAQVTVMIRQSNVSLLMVTRFEFLPPSGII
jgi:hypothetical protein